MNYPHQAIHIRAKNSPVNKHNAFILNSMNNPLFVINAIDVLLIRKSFNHSLSIKSKIETKWKQVELKTCYN